MPQIVLEGGEPTPLAQMLAAMVEANVAADPGKARIVETTRGVVQLDVTDAQVTVGLKFTPGALVISSAAVPGADLRIRADSETLLGLSSMPTRFGLPDLTTSAGRAVVGKLAARKLTLHGMAWRSPALLRKVSRLLSVR